jgi:hypothetical protein
MPDFVKGLGDVKECSGAVCFVFEGFVNPVNDAMRLFDGGVSPPEAELASGYSVVVLDEWKECLRSSFSKSLDTMGKRLIGQ